MTLIRITGSPGIVIFAALDQIGWIVALVVVLVLTEWLDGFLARALHQESETGARLDTLADALFYGSLLIAAAVIEPNLLFRETTWIVLAIGTYVVSWIVSLIKFRQFPSYHTWAAKAAWLIVGIGVVVYLAQWGQWPLRIAMVFVAIANIEAILITRRLVSARVNVPSIWHAKIQDPDPEASHGGSHKE
ncbi:MAG: phosphatidylglycerophosphate synthase [Pirellulaceae bacterium]|nr:phosphatidylglycerophosphate synthase [Pirellulaceae bacterium]